MNTQDKPHVKPIDEAKFAELVAGGKYIEGTPLPMKRGDTHWVEVIQPQAAKAGVE